ncbi:MULTISPECIES: glycerol-3-phosphate 1-O-acyltransferase PlsY [Aerococcus]|uniref:glycerol-3-phosphate 1-O-acyltransferase PlsY n=1 Tax=Aerococcus TaxID=1375 RepID=UPI0015EC49E5|nr:MULTISPECIES: glycerol-3-phosphate 1-O-acyltransferase PlsY [Aerococcus]MDL5183503.1 glycerol-3-phosphate 1-O-acyltransferase PlsY [Aerococcus mictus]MBU5610324.1 glycerol-3-phosphate 1-O-acyltransferase PlsY [Aerococcus urinae]MDK6292293.1 glycerol-3-phosphate 1-O-acyltransferase PlsY [Aerococcus urinae]MDK6375762.1 glycerol-3-phosphate 1-O-acyltransferase PlsY [Aerococcus urinae]MDK6420426.1 glycerol-3-phosphate 1-O-acyltransferase PlsY [Aerococcus urinae]
MIINLIFLFISYLLGSIPFGVVIGKYLYHKDIRGVGSGNIGTTNAFRAFGPKGGLLVFLCDMVKGMLPVLIANYSSHFTDIDSMLFGLAAILGHTFSLFLHFKGGKAVATSFGVGLALAPLASLGGIAVFFIVLYLFRMVSLASIIAMIAASIISFHYAVPIRILILFITLLIIFRHKDNIKRILAGKEAKVPFGLGYKKNKQ